MLVVESPRIVYENILPEFEVLYACRLLLSPEFSREIESDLDGGAMYKDVVNVLGSILISICTPALLIVRSLRGWPEIGRVGERCGVGESRL